MPSPPWEEIEHTADVALRVRGNTLPDLFANAARGLFALSYGPESPPIEGAQQVEFTLDAPDLETLLVDWLTELAYRIEDEGFVATGVEVTSLVGNALTATVTGAPGGHPQRHVKAVTYHDLAITHTHAGYQATVVFDV